MVASTVMGEKQEKIVLDAEVIEDDPRAVEAKAMSPDVFSAGEKIADELSEASKKLRPVAGKAADKGEQIADAVRVASTTARAISGHMSEIKAAVGEVVDVVESRGFNVRQTAARWRDKVWQATPGPFSQSEE